MVDLRGRFTSRIGFVLAAAGSAVGLGNIWKFPYMTGENGGGAFLVIYLVMVFSIGLSVMMAEIALGRAAERSPVGAFRRLKGGRWTAVGYLGVATGFLILSFYAVVGGWTLAYALKSISGQFAFVDPAQAGIAFTAFVSGTAEPLVYFAIFMTMTAAVVMAGIASGIELAAKVLMPVFFVLLAILLVRVLTLDGAAAGIAFFLKPDFSKVSVGTVLAAMGQAFFSLSLGMGAMLAYGSYLSRRVSLPGAAIQVTVLDTLVALLAGLVVLPAVFAFGMDPAAGPGLTFITLPAVFGQLPAGGWIGLAFFVMLAVAALTSAVSLLEVVTSHFIDEHGMRRAPAAAMSAAVIFVLGVPSSLAFGVGAEMTLFGRNFFGLIDYLASNLMLPMGGILIAVFAAWVAWPRVLEEVSGWTRQSRALVAAWRLMLGIVAPLAIGWVMISGLSG